MEGCVSRTAEMRRDRGAPDTSEQPSSKKKKANNHEQETSLNATQAMLEGLDTFGSQGFQEYDQKINDSVSCGVLEKIRLVNFMCHRRLEVDFNSNVNFIHGRNGSGKSAILTGVVTGLGGKAAVTSRGSSMRGFVRTGEQFAEVTIWLANTGVDCYRPDVYGKSIEVSRRINVDGTSSYKLKSCRNGSTVSTKKDELLAILDQFNIQVDNPVSLLNQDTSRNFLHVTDAKAKYKLFMKATLLDSIATDCVKAEEAAQRHHDAVEQKEEEIKFEQKSIKDLEDQWKGFQKLREMEEQINNLKRELKWAHVVEIEKGLQNENDNIDVNKAKIGKREEKLSQLQTSRGSVEKSKSQAEENLRVKMEELKSLEQEKQVAEDERRARAKVHVEKARELKKIDRNLRAKLEERRAVQARIEEIKQKEMEKESKAARKSERVHKETVLQEMQNELTALKSTSTGDQESKRQVEHSMEETTREKEKCRRDVAALKDKIQDNVTTARRLQDARSNRLKGFGSWMPQVVQAINQSRAFKKKPIGPLGMYLKVKEADRKWSFAVECAIGIPNMSLFFCDNHHDRQQLQNIFRQFIQDRRQFPDTQVAPFKDHPFRDKPLAQVPYKTVAQVLEVEQSHPLVINYLLETRMNRTLLIWEYSESRRFMWDRCPTDYGVAFSKEGNRTHRDQRCYAEKRQPRVMFLQATSEESLRELHGENQRWTAEAQQLEGHLDGFSSQEEQDRRELARLKTLLRSQKSKMDGLYKNTMALETELALLVDDDEDESYDVAGLEEEIDVMNQEIEDVKKDMSEQKNVILAAKGEEATAQQGVDSVQATIDREMTETEKLSTVLDRVAQELGKYEYKCEHLREAMQTFQSNIHLLEESVKEQEKLLNQATQDAEQMCEDRMETKRSPAAIDRQIKQITAILSREKNNNAHDWESVRTRLAEKLEWYQDTVKTIESSKQTLAAVTESLRKRFVILNQVQQMIMLRACEAFRMHLKRRGYNGNLVFDHQQEKMEMKVTVDAAAKSSKNQKTLSGGERSFATVCFVLALWDAIEAPFRILDEFDVFMDMLNRKISMKLLLESAQMSKTNQFIFLTPNNMSDLVPMEASRLSLLVLEPPERRSTTDSNDGE